METNRHVGGHLHHSLLLVVLLTAGCGSTARNQEAALPKEQPGNAAGYKEFLTRVQAYVDLHKSLESTLPALKSTDVPELIAAHQQALARKIREARPDAKRGDIFTEDAEKAFRSAVQGEFQGAQGSEARTTIRQGEPLRDIQLRVNEAYPDGVPFTTVPPTLLLKLPRLPDQVAYRIVGRDLILLDTKANVVVDRIPDTIP
jgi:hypothetical protein